MRRAPETVITPRLRGERLGPQHQAAIEQIFGDPRVGATMGGVMTSEQVTAQLTLAARVWERDGFGYWMFFDAATGAPAGRGGLSPTVFDGQPEVEVGWTVVPERWGEGLATELGAAALAVAAEARPRRHRRLHAPANTASRRVMEKLGFVYEKTAPYKVYGDHVLYRRRS